MKTKIAITALSSISPLGKTTDSIWQNYTSNKTVITSKNFNGKPQFVAVIPSEIRREIEELKTTQTKYKALDETVLLAILASRQAIQEAGWQKGNTFGVNIGSSRGATQLFEKQHKEFLETANVATLTSPTTTLGNISSWVAQDLKSQGPEISHSITCSTALHAILNAIAWLESGMSTKFLVGASETPLTPFTLAQMHALKIYSKHTEIHTEFPCRAFDLEKTKNTMVLGEATAIACLEKGERDNAKGYIIGFGYAIDELQHGISISDEALCFQKSMVMALGNINPQEVDAIVMHAPGTIKGDSSEFKAIQKVFGDNLPLLTTNKWKIGHTFGTSGLLSIEMALLMMQNNQFIAIPYTKSQKDQREIKKVMINAVGFGGNAVTILLSRE